MTTEQAISELDEIVLKGNTDLPAELLIVIFEALREKQERENPKPLTPEELKERFGKPVWIAVKEDGTGEPSCWAIVGDEWESENGIELHDLIKGDGGAYELYGKTWLVYDHEPKEARR